MFHSAVNPKQVYYRHAIDFSAIPNNILEADDHAVEIAGIMISTDAVARGVASANGGAAGADLYSIGGVTGPSLPDIYSQVAENAQQLITLPPQKIWAINMSINVNAGGADLDGNTLLTAFVDWSARVHDVSYVIAGFQTGGAGPLPSDNFNGITVGSSSKPFGENAWRVVTDSNIFVTNPDGDRTFIDLLAPGTDVVLTKGGSTLTTPPHPPGTSNAAPHVTGTVALLQQHATGQIGQPRWNAARARRHEVVKAVLMNSADKIIDDGTFTIPGDAQPALPGTFLGMERTVEDVSGDNWLESEAYTGGNETFVPLDDQIGAGHLNANRALQQYSPGEYDNDAADVPLIGWDFGHTTGEDDNNRYAFAQPLLGGSFISVTLAWDRRVEFQTDTAPLNAFNIGDSFEPSASPSFFPENDDQINDLDLYLLPKGAFTLGEAIEGAESISTVGTVEHIFFRIPTTGEYEFWVNQFDADIAGGQDYAVAWWAATVANPNPSTGDYSGNGTVGPEDYTIWKANFGTAFAAADGNGNGIVDAADYTIWRDHLGQMVGSGSASPSLVPEPSSFFLLSIGSVLAAARRRKT